MSEPIAAEPSLIERVDPPLRFKLSLMMFLQYATWGAWFSVLSKYLLNIEFTSGQIAEVYATIAIASIFSPLIFGQIADRWVPVQYLLVFCHLVGAVLLYCMTLFTDFGNFYLFALLYALLYIPTISLTNALSLHHIPNAEKQFPLIRVFGTIGWIAAGLFVGAFLVEDTAQPLLLACGLSVILGLFCFFLPHTPPKGKSGELFPFIRAFGMLRNGNFALFTAVSFIIAVVLAGYYAWTAPFLQDVGQNLDVPLFRDSAAAVMTLGQFTEMLLLPLLPFFLVRFGMKYTLLLGMAAWGLRYGFFALEGPAALIWVGIALHGICYDFFFVAAYIHVDNRAGKEIRASAQAMFNLVTMGLGMYLGNQFFGWLIAYYPIEEVMIFTGKAAGWVNSTLQLTEITMSHPVYWPLVWAWPLVGAVVACLIFLIFFKDRKKPILVEAGGAESEASIEAGTAS